MSLYFKNGKIKPIYKLDNLDGWLPIEITKKEFDKKTHKQQGWEFEILENKVVAKPLIIKKEKKEE